MLTLGKRSRDEELDEEYRPQKFARLDDYEKHLRMQSLTPTIDDSGLGTSLSSLPPSPIMHPVMNLVNSIQAPHFCTVVGRLSLSGMPRKYSVTVDEIKRRVGPPECLNSSILTGMLRKAKLTGKSRSLRGELAERGIDLKLGRKKQTTTTAFTALLEGEALTLAQDLDGVTQEHYPTQQLASHLRARVVGACLTQDAIEVYKRDLIGFMKTFAFLEMELRSIESPICDRNPPKHENAELQQSMDQYSLLTHGFAPYNMRTWLRTFIQVACNTLQQLECVTGGPAPMGLPNMTTLPAVPEPQTLPPLPQSLPDLLQSEQICQQFQPAPNYFASHFGNPMYNLYQPQFMPSAPESFAAYPNLLQPPMPMQPNVEEWCKILTPINS